MSDDYVKNLLHSAFPHADSRKPSRDLWPSVVERIQASTKWSPFDVYVAVSVVAGGTIALVMLPKALLLLASQL
jgi:hypothetical protein